MMYNVDLSDYLVRLVSMIGIFWKGGRVVEGAALEKRYTRKGIEGSNPSLSAGTVFF